MSDPIDDKALEEYLKRNSAVSQQYREIGAEEVPPELDRRVLRAAREAAARRAEKPAWMRWSAPLALAASAVLVVAIVIESGVQEEIVYVPRRGFRSVAPAPAETPAQESRWGGDTAADNAASARDEVAPSAPAAAPPAVLMKEQPAPPVPVKPESAQSTPRQSAPQAREEPKEVAITAKRRENREESERAVSTQGMAMEAHSEPEPQRVTSSTAVRQTTAIRQTSEAAKQPSESDPERWLEEIRALRRQDKADEADLEWERFRKSFPDYHVAETDVARKSE